MTRVVLEAWAALVVLSFVSIGLMLVVAAGASLLTVARARRRRRPLPGQYRDLARGCAPEDLAEIDAALRKILAEEHASWFPARSSVESRN